MHMTIRRFIAYIFDLFVVLFLAGTLSMTPLNPNYDDKVDLQTEYQTKHEEVTKKMEELSEDDAKKEFEDFYVYYKSTLKEVSKLNVYDDVITVSMFLLYFVVFVYFFEGETVGKRLLRVKIVDKNDKRASLWKLFLRAFVLYEIPFTIYNLVASYVLGNDAFAVSYSIMYIVSNVLMIAIAISIKASKDRRGLHDLIAGTKVVERK